MRIEKNNILEKAVSNLIEQTKSDVSIVNNIETNESRTKSILQIRGIDFICEVKGNITNANVNIILQQLINQKDHYNKPLLLVVKYIYPGLMNEFSDQGISILDSAGNCIIRQDNLFLVIKGQKNLFVKEANGRAFQETGIKLIFHFLKNPESVNLPYRNISEQTNISLGAIKNVIEELTAIRFILKTNNGRFLKNRKKLLEHWIMAYNQTLKPKLLLNQMTFISNEKRDKWLSMSLPEGMYWGGESGAHLIDGYLFPGTFDIYTDIPTKMILSTGFVTPKEDGEIKIYQKFWLEKPDSCIVPTLLIYADLMGSGNSRCIEIAHKIFEHEFSDFK